MELQDKIRQLPVFRDCEPFAAGEVRNALDVTVREIHEALSEMTDCTVTVGKSGNGAARKTYQRISERQLWLRMPWAARSMAPVFIPGEWRAQA